MCATFAIRQTPHVFQTHAWIELFWNSTNKKNNLENKTKDREKQIGFLHLHIHTSITTCFPALLFPQTTIVITVIIALIATTRVEELRGRKSHHRHCHLSPKIKLVKSVHNVNTPNKNCCKKIHSSVKLDNLK